MMGKLTQFAIAAAHMALTQAGLAPSSVAPQRLGVAMGTAHDSGDFLDRHNLWTRMKRHNGEGEDMGKLWEVAKNHANPMAFLCALPNGPAAHMAILHNAQGPNCSLLTPDVASTQAIGEAAHLIAHGEADLMIAGGAASDVEVERFLLWSKLGLLSQQTAMPEKASRPFDRQRDGLVLGEGAGVVVLEELAHARHRGASIYGEVCGYASTFAPWEGSEERAPGGALATAMRLALADAALQPPDVSYIAAHAHATRSGDRQETQAIKEVFGQAARRVPVSSTKSMLGYLNTAAGAVDIIVCLLALQHGVIPPTINYEYPDPDCDLDYVPNVARPAEVRVAMSNAVGFHGAAATVVVKRYET